MPRPTTKVDRVAYAEAKLLQHGSGIEFFRLEKLVSRQSAKQEMRLLRERGGEFSRYFRHRGRGPTRSRWVTLLFYLVFAAMIATLLLLLPLLPINIIKSVPNITAVSTPLILTTVSLTLLASWRMDSRLGAIRYLRTKPMQELLRASTQTRDEIAARTTNTLLVRLRARDALFENDKARASNLQLLPLSSSIVAAILVIGLLTAGWALLAAKKTMLIQLMPVGIFLLFTLLSLRRSTSKEVDRLRKEHKCPNCSFDINGLPPHPLTQRLHPLQQLSLGPPLCPECGMHWPLVPPPTPEEVLSAP